MQVLWFANQLDCDAALEIINANLRVLAVDNGYDLDDDGNIIGKDASGDSQPDAQPTTAWDVSHYDPLTDAWWVTDPIVRYDEEARAQLLHGATDYTEGEYFYPPDPE